MDLNNKLDIKLYRKKESLPILDNVLYGIFSVFLANAFIPNISTINILLLYWVTNYFVAPFVANIIVKWKVGSYIKKNHKEMISLKEGEENFFLYTVHYKLNWVYK